MPHKPTAKQTRALTFISKGMSARQAMLKAGYSAHTADNPGTHLWGLVGTQAYMNQMLVAHIVAGNTPEEMALTLRELLRATKKQVIPQGKKRIVIEVPDFAIRARGIELWLKSIELGAKYERSNQPAYAIQPSRPIQSGSFKGREAVVALMSRHEPQDNSKAGKSH